MIAMTNKSESIDCREYVIPGKAKGRDPESRKKTLDSRLRGNDDSIVFSIKEPSSERQQSESKAYAAAY